MILHLIRKLREIVTPTPRPEPLHAIVPDTLRDEYEAIPRGPKGVRRKRNSVAALAARHKMTVAELKSAVRRYQ